MVYQTAGTMSCVFSTGPDVEVTFLTIFYPDKLSFKKKKKASSTLSKCLSRVFVPGLSSSSNKLHYEGDEEEKKPSFNSSRPAGPVYAFLANLY